MQARSTVARLDGGGRLEVVRLGVRFSEAAFPERSEEGVIGPISFVEGPLIPGVQRLGPFQLTISLDAAGDVASYDLLVRNLAEAPLHLESVVLGFRWTEIETGALRFLRHGWQSWSFTGARALRANPSFPPVPGCAAYTTASVLRLRTAPDGTSRTWSRWSVGPHLPLRAWRECWKAASGRGSST
jgi:hypothetical protein